MNVLSSITLDEWGLIIIALSFTSYLLGIFRNLAPVAVFIGILMVGFSGRVITILAGIERVGLSLLGRLGAGIFGVSASAVVAVVVAVLLFVMLHDWAPRHPGKKRTFWLSVGLAVLIVAGATPFVALNQLPATVRTGVTSVTGS